MFNLRAREFTRFYMRLQHGPEFAAGAVDRPALFAEVLRLHFARFPPGKHVRLDIVQRRLD